MTDKERPYDRQEWVKIATKWLHGSADSSMLDSAHIALRIDEPELAAQLKEESKRRRTVALARLRKGN